MKIKLTQPLAAASGSFNVGDEYTCASDAEALRMVKAGFGVLVETKAKTTAKRTTKEKRG